MTEFDTITNKQVLVNQNSWAYSVGEVRTMIVSW